MRSVSEQLRLDLACGQILRLDAAAGYTVAVDAGCLWLTVDGQSADVILSAGEHHYVCGRGDALVEAFEATRLRLVQRAFVHEPIEVSARQRTGRGGVARLVRWLAGWLGRGPVERAVPC